MSNHHDAIRVLAVDDDPSLAAVLHAALDCLGFDCVFATSADEAAEMLDEIDPAIVLCDFELPGTLSASDLYQLVRDRGSGRFVLMTGHRALTAPGNLPPDTVVLHKPFRLDALRQALNDETPGAATLPA